MKKILFVIGDIQLSNGVMQIKEEAERESQIIESNSIHFSFSTEV